MENEVLETKNRNRNYKKIIVIILLTVILLGVLLGCFFAFKFIFPTDKDLFLMVHINAFDDENEDVEIFTKKTDISLDFDEGFASKNAVDVVKSISISTKNTQLSDDKSSYDFNMQFLGKDFLTFSAVTDEEKEFLTVPELINETYSADGTDEILSVLLGSEKADDKDILEGVDVDRVAKYLKEYGSDLYNNIHKNAFTSVKKDDVKIITFKDNVNRMFYSIANEMKDDTEFRDFLYEQTSIIYSNFNAKYPYAGTLLTIPEKADYDKDYEETFDNFIKDIENREITITTHVIGKKLISETIKISDNDEVVYDISYDQKNVEFIQYKDSLENMHYSSLTEFDGSKKVNKTVLTIDLNEMTKVQIDGQKKASIIINSITDTNITEKIAVPENYIEISSLSNEDKEKIKETAGENVTSLLTSFTLSLLFLVN